MEKKIFNKGYTVRVVSWENDGDHYATKELTVETEAEAQELRKLALVCRSKSNYYGDELRIGNANGDNFDDYMKNIAEFMRSLPILSNKRDSMETDEDFNDLFYDYNFELLGGSEWYLSRVTESVEIFYSPEDIFVDFISRDYR